MIVPDGDDVVGAGPAHAAHQLAVLCLLDVGRLEPHPATGHVSVVTRPRDGHDCAVSLQMLCLNPPAANIVECR